MTQPAEQQEVPALCLAVWKERERAVENARDDSFVTASHLFLESLAARGMRPATISIRRLGLEQFGHYLRDCGIERAQDITLTTLREYRRQMFDRGLSQNTVESYLRAVRLLLDFLEDRGLVFENPARRMHLHQKAHPLPHVPSPAQVRKLLATLDVSTVVGVRDRALLELLYSTGVRVGEASRLNTSDVDLDYGSVSVSGKGGHERILPLGTCCCWWLAEYLRTARSRLCKPGTSTEALWIGVRGTRLTRIAIERMMRTVSRKAGIRPTIAPHALRRAMATHMLQNGASPLVIQELLGHASMRHLSQYLRLSITDLRAMHKRSLPGT